MSNINLKQLISKITKSLSYMGEYETGVDNGWTYYKYPDGTYDAFQKAQLTGLSLTTSSAGTYYGPATDGTGSNHDFAYPSFQLTPRNANTLYGNAVVTPTLGSGLYVYSVELGNDWYRLNIRAHASVSSNYAGVLMHLKGKWKANASSVVLPTYATTQCPDTFLSLGDYETAATVSNSGCDLRFSIPTGRVLSHTNIDKIAFGIVARISNSGTTAAANGIYIVKSTSGGTATVPFISSTNCPFYNGSNVVKTLSPSGWVTKSIEGNTNIKILLRGTDTFFTGSYNAQTNNQSAVVELENIQVWLS